MTNSLPAPADTPDGSRHPLRRFSLRDSASELETLVQQQTPLLGNFCLKGQATVLYAKPNTGKTLLTIAQIIEAVREGRLIGDETYYIDADDTAAGAVEKINILKPLGVHVLVPGFKGFDAKDLGSLLMETAMTGAAANRFVILDTLKKSVSLMDKGQSSQFAENVRRYVMAGGTFLGLAHTNKRTDKDGRPIYAGTSDMLDDFDCGYTIMEIAQRSKPGERVVQFDCIKSRGNVAQQVAYAYKDGGSVPYAEKIDSVRLLDADELTSTQRESDAERDSQIIDVIVDAIREGQGASGKMELAKEVSARTKIGRHTIGTIIDRYAGDDWTVHRWKFDVGGRGKRGYVLLEKPLTPEELAAVQDAF
jgi:hypothetical protein